MAVVQTFNVTFDDALNKAKKIVHSNHNLKYYDFIYNREKTNCYSYALGLTNTDCIIKKRPGAFSRLKKVDDPFFSALEMKKMTISDLKTLELNPIEIFFDSNYDLIQKVESYEYDLNQHAIILFNGMYPNGDIGGFHFIRYDKLLGWSEKCGINNYRLLNIYKYDWPGNKIMNLNSAFIVTR